MPLVGRSAARKSSVSASVTPVCGPSATTVEKPTRFWRAQSRIEAVSAPDCDTSASWPGVASAPETLALSCSCGRWKPWLLGPSSHTPWRRAMRCSSWARLASSPLDSTSAAFTLMRPASSRAAPISSSGRAMMARSARACARSARVPVVCTLSGSTSPLNACACRCASSARACGVCCSGASCAPVNRAIARGSNKGVR